MKINKETLERIANLAMLEIREDEQAQMLKDLRKMIHWIEQLQEVNTENVLPITNMSVETTVLREDKIGLHLNREQALKNAPDQDSLFFRVPKFLDH